MKEIKSEGSTKKQTKYSLTNSMNRPKGQKATGEKAYNFLEN